MRVKLWYHEDDGITGLLEFMWEGDRAAFAVPDEGDDYGWVCVTREGDPFLWKRVHVSHLDTIALKFPSVEAIEMKDMKEGLEYIGWKAGF